MVQHVFALLSPVYYSFDVVVFVYICVNVFMCFLWNSACKIIFFQLIDFLFLVKVKSPSKLYGNWTIHHHPKETPVVNEEELGQNPFSMDSSDCFADPTQDWDSVVANRMLKKDNIWQCLECSYMARNKTSVISHVQGKHLEEFGGYICKIC